MLLLETEPSWGNIPILLDGVFRIVHLLNSFRFLFLFFSEGFFCWLMKLWFEQLEAMKHGYSKNGAVSVPDTFWVLVLLGYSCMRTPGVPKFFKKTKSFSFIFSIRYVTKIDESSESGRNMNFKCNYIDIHFFYLLFWILICNLKTI
jgi:hypothetical protein